jgi:hypothetical protein
MKPFNSHTGSQFDHPAFDDDECRRLFASAHCTVTAWPFVSWGQVTTCLARKCASETQDQRRPWCVDSPGNRFAYDDA